MPADEEEVGGEEEHGLGVAGGSAVEVACLKEVTRGGSGLVYGGLECVDDDVGKEEADGLEKGVELPAEEEVAQGKEDGDPGDPRQEVPQLVPYADTGGGSTSQPSGTAELRIWSGSWGCE